jgi:hypothetical protein
MKSLSGKKGSLNTYRHEVDRSPTNNNIQTTGDTNGSQGSYENQAHTYGTYEVDANIELSTSVCTAGKLIQRPH